MIPNPNTHASDEVATSQHHALSVDESDSKSAQTNRSVKLLIAHEDSAIAQSTKSLFTEAGWVTHTHKATSLEDLQASLQEGEWNILLAYSSSELFHPSVLTKLIEQSGSEVHAIFLDQSYASETALQMARLGFKDYITDSENERLLYIAAREVDAQKDHRIAADTDKVLAEANARSQLLLDTTTDAIAYVIDGMIVHSNPVFAEHFQFENCEETEYFPFIDLVSEKDQANLRGLLRQYQMGEKNESSACIEAITITGATFNAKLELAFANYEDESCTQVIIHHEKTNDTPQNPENTISSQTANNLDTAAPTPLATDDHAEPKNHLTIVKSDSTSNFHIEQIQALNGKGSLLYVTLDNASFQRNQLGLEENLHYVKSVEEAIVGAIPLGSQFLEYLGDSWIITIPDETQHDEIDLAKKLCADVASLSSLFPATKSSCFVLIGVSKYGVADLSSEDALHRAFAAASEVPKNTGGGYKLHVPKIDNAEGANALQSALELNRFRLRYQPIIALRNQTAHFYESLLYIEDESGCDQSAEQLLNSLGIESTNTELDRWVVKEAIATLQSNIVSNAKIQLSVPLTASALMDDNFQQWLLDSLIESQLPASCIAFSVSADDAQDYEHRTIDLVKKLSSNGYTTVLLNTSNKHIALVESIKPDFAKMSSELTESLSGEDAGPSLMREMIETVNGKSSICIASQISSAGELAMLWQTGVHYVQGSYLQAPLSTMNYEFSDIA